MRAEYATLAAASALLLAACSRPPAAADAGVDAGQDGGQDGGQDAGPPYVRFAPRLLFNDPTVHCEPPPPPEMRAPVGPRPPLGTVRWVYDPRRDPAAADSFSTTGIAGISFGGRGMLGLPSGGFVVPLNEQRYYLGVTPEGGFDFISLAAMSIYGASWLMPSTLITRPSSEVMHGGPQLHFVETAGRDLVGPSAVSRPPVPLPGFDLGNRTPGPTVLANGTVVWTPTHNTLMAVCSDGRARGVLEFYTNGYTPNIYAAGDGNIVLEVGPSGIYRIDPDGNVLASRDRSDVSMFYIDQALGYSDRCGLAFMHLEYDNGIREYPVLRGIQYLSGEDFSVSRELPGTSMPTTDCGGWKYNPASSALRRYRPDGSVGFESAELTGGIVGGEGPIELADGSWLSVLSHVGTQPASLTIVADDGSVTFHRELDASVVGDTFSDLYLLTPNGVLYLASSFGVFGDGPQLVAIEVGMGRATPWFGGGTGTGGTWARDNAAWHTPATP